MNKRTKVFISYFPVILVSIQIMANIFGLVSNEAYLKIGFYLNTFIGTNILFSLFLVAFTQFFRFCKVSRYAALAELLFGLNYLIVQEDNLYNVIFQITVGVLALVLTFRYYIHRFPLCRISLLASFLKNVFRYHGNCNRAFDGWEKEMKINAKRHVANN